MIVFKSKKRSFTHFRDPFRILELSKPDQTVFLIDPNPYGIPFHVTPGATVDHKRVMPWTYFPTVNTFFCIGAQRTVISHFISTSWITGNLQWLRPHTTG